MAPPPVYSGRWFTTFGSMQIEQRAAKATGTYRYRGVEGRLEGTVRGDALDFRYDEPGEAGSGEFRLLRPGRFSGTYLPDGAPAPRRWNGHRGWDGIWETDYGRMRLLHEESGVHGWYGGATHSSIVGTLQDGEFAFRYEEKSAAGEGRFTLSDDGESFSGRWRQDGVTQWQPWTGHRLAPMPGLRWLVVLESHWQRSLTEPEFSFGGMLREIFARTPGVRVRQRFFHDAETLERWCRELAYLSEPAVLLVASHGLPEGLHVHGRIIDTSHVIDSLQYAESLELLHFSSCLVGQDGGKALARRRWPVSGYATSVDWGASALLEFTYLDLLLNRGLAPDAAAALLPRLVPYAGDNVDEGLPYPAAGFRFLPAP